MRREVVEVGVVVARVVVLASNVTGHGLDVVLSASICLRFILQIFEDGWAQVMIIAIAKIEVASIAREVSLDRVISANFTNLVPEASPSLNLK